MGADVGTRTAVRRQPLSAQRVYLFYGSGRIDDSYAAILTHGEKVGIARDDQVRFGRNCAGKHMVIIWIGDDDFRRIERIDRESKGTGSRRSTHATRIRSARYAQRTWRD